MLLQDRVLFIDGEALVVDKPAGLPVTQVRDGSISVENHLSSLTFGFQRWPTVVHRLDRDTSGCLLLARNPKAHKRFAAAFEAGTIKKSYWAILQGDVVGDNGVIDLALSKISSAAEGWRMVADPKGKSAVSHWRVLKRHAGQTFVEFTPETGRTHQLRVHAATALNAPIVGDPVYGTGGPAMLLHARSLRFERAGKADVIAEAPAPRSFMDAGFDDV